MRAVVRCRNMVRVREKVGGQVICGIKIRLSLSIRVSIEDNFNMRVKMRVSPCQCQSQSLGKHQAKTQGSVRTG